MSPHERAEARRALAEATDKIRAELKKAREAYVKAGPDDANARLLWETLRAELTFFLERGETC